MTISEFIYAFDDGSVYAEYDEQGNVYIYDNTCDSMMAQLIINSSVWEVENNGFVMSPSLLRLMAELADTPPVERTPQQRYVILNSEPRHQHWDYFMIGDKNEYLKSFSTNNQYIFIANSYTLEELEKEKRWLPEKWRNAIDSMLTPLDVALKEGKDDHMEQDRPSCTVRRDC
jgi:hypothetical protein